MQQIDDKNDSLNLENNQSLRSIVQGQVQNMKDLVLNFINEAGRRQFGITALENNVGVNEIAFDSTKQRELLEMPIFKSMDDPNR